MVAGEARLATRQNGDVFMIGARASPSVVDGLGAQLPDHTTIPNPCQLAMPL